ncbi:iron ABC transporter permease, partial [Anoxybacillus flavithermus]|nr:iron ABC transporter permease [Anoxybacillus flavithermus]
MRKRYVGLVACLALLLIIIVPLGACFGDVKVPVSQVWEAFFNRKSSLNGEIVWEYRLPRILVGLFVGANLAVSGALLQAVTQNPLAAPNVIGM